MTRQRAYPVRGRKLLSQALRKQLERFNQGATVRATPFTFIDLFSGCGGFGLGFLLAGFRPLAAVDSDREACDTHRMNFDRYGCITTQADLRELKPRQLKAILEHSHGRKTVDVILGGPPCQGWSRAGRGKLKSLGRPTRNWTEDPRNALFRRFVSYVSFFRPKYVIMENVPGMLSHRGTDVTPVLSRAFGRIGYRTAMYVLDAVDFGVPQRRTRLFFVGTPKKSPYPVDQLLTPITRLNLYHRGAYIEQPWHVTVREALSDLPRLPTDHRAEITVYKSSRRRRAPYASFMRAGMNGLLRDHVTRLHREMDKAAFRALRPGMKYGALDRRLKRYREDIFKDKYRKLSLDAPAGTVTAHLSHDCYTHIHPRQLRTISPREAARLQSFPDGFQFCGNVGDRFRQVGNAVAPLLAYRIARVLLGNLTQGKLRGR
jgi:DNA (cytosine-5)-methyltransferase 1